MLQGGGGVEADLRGVDSLRSPGGPAKTLAVGLVFYTVVSLGESKS